MGTILFCCCCFLTGCNIILCGGSGNLLPHKEKEKAVSRLFPKNLVQEEFWGKYWQLLNVLPLPTVAMVVCWNHPSDVMCPPNYIQAFHWWHALDELPRTLKLQSHQSHSATAKASKLQQGWTIAGRGGLCTNWVCPMLCQERARAVIGSDANMQSLLPGL